MREVSVLTIVALAAWWAGCGDGQEPLLRGLSPLPTVPGYAVVLSDYTSTAVAVLDADAQVLDPEWFDSGTVLPGLVASLSGDVVLPNQPASDQTLTVIDRFRTDVVSRFKLPSGELLGQVRTHGDSDSAGFSSNPHDLVFVDGSEAWITRYAPNLDSAAPEIDRGNDLIQIDPTSMALTGRRIDLTALNSTVHPDGGDPVIVYARPSRAVRLGAVLVVGLARLSADFRTGAAGMVALVDLDQQSAEGLVFEDLAGCTTVVPVVGESDRVAVGCAGYARPFGEEVQVRATAGIVLLRADGGEASVEHVWRTSADPAVALSVNHLLSLGGDAVVAVAWGKIDPPEGDRLFWVDLVTGQQRLVHESEGSFAIGTPSFRPEDGILLVPDAADGLIHRYRFEGSEAVHEDAFEILNRAGLPPRSIHCLR